jgi:hypothetical protein
MKFPRGSCVSEVPSSLQSHTAAWPHSSSLMHGLYSRLGSSCIQVTHTLERERPLSHTHSLHTHPCMHGLFSRLASTVYRFLECVCVGGSSVCESVCVGFARVRVRVCVLVSPVWVYVWVWERVRVFLGGDLRNLARSQALNPRPLRNQARSQALNPRPLRNLARSQALNPKP